MEGLDIGLRYEGKATMDLTNDTKLDTPDELFKDGKKTNADMPAMLGVGVAYKAIPSLRVVADFNYYFNEDVNWDGREEFVENGMEYGVGLDFAVSDALRLSAGVLIGSGGTLKGYATDLSHSFNTSTIGVGGRYYVNPNLYISFGVADTFYDEISNDGVSYGSITGNETFDKTSLDFAIGIGYSR
jgi:long-subunit fatty acid transport protein